MKFNIIDSESIYRRLLATADVAEREVIYREELLGPFAGMMRIFGGGDAIAMAKMWTMYTPEELEDGARSEVESMLNRLAAYDAWNKGAAALERGRAVFAPYAERIPLEMVTFAFVLTHQGNPLDRGYSGFGGIPGYIMAVFSDPNDYNLPRLSGMVVHELHHNVRFTLFPFNPMMTTVGEYIVAEGLAEAFAAEQFGEEVVGYYVTDFNEDALATAKRVIGGSLDVTGFNEVRGYIFGDALASQMGLPKAGVPDYAGYAMGYRVVRQYLSRTGETVAEATFVPAQEIIAESGFFA